MECFRRSSAEDEDQGYLSHLYKVFSQSQELLWWVGESRPWRD